VVYNGTMNAPSFTLTAKRVMISQVGDTFVCFVYRPKDSTIFGSLQRAKVFTLDIEDETGEWFTGAVWKVTRSLEGLDNSYVMHLKRANA